MLDPTSIFLWYSVAICVLCCVVAFVADLMDKADARRERWQERERARLSRESSPARGPGNLQIGETSSNV